MISPIIDRYMIVSFPIEVPKGSYCWNGNTICPHFRNPGGHSRCKLKLGNLKEDVVGLLKSKECLELVEIV